MDSSELTQYILVTIFPSIGSSISLLASCSINVFILRSETKLKKPFRRIIFVMSFFDSLTAISLLLGVVAAPSESIKPLAVGNQGTCMAQGFIQHIGSMGSPLYTLSLAFFYLLTIKYDMKEETFRLKYEYYLHIIPNVFIWASAIYLLSDGYFNDAGYGCWIASYPDDCGNDSEVPCIRGEKAFLYRWIFAGIPILIAFFASLIIMIKIVAFIGAINKKNQKHRKRAGAGADHSTSSSHIARNSSSMIANNSVARNSNNSVSILMDQDSESSPNVMLAPVPPRNRSESRRASFIPPSMRSSLSVFTTASTQAGSESTSTKKYLQVKRQAIFFMATFLSAYLFSYTHRLVEQYFGFRSFTLLMMGKCFFSLRGLLNVLVYTRPHVISLRRKSPSLSWFQAFWAVLKRGGDHGGMDKKKRRSRRRLSWIARQKPIINHSLVSQDESKVMLPVPPLDGRKKLTFSEDVEMQNGNSTRMKKLSSSTSSRLDCDYNNDEEEEKYEEQYNPLGSIGRKENQLLLKKSLQEEKKTQLEAKEEDQHDQLESCRTREQLLLKNKSSEASD